MTFLILMVKWLHFESEDKFIIFCCESSQDFMHQKLSKPVLFDLSYSKHKRVTFLLELKNNFFNRINSSD